MLNEIKNFFDKVFKIRPDEFMLVQAFFLYYTCVGMFYTVGATVGDSMFLSNVASERISRLLPWVYVGIAVATIVTTWLYHLFQPRLSRIVMLVGTQVALLASVVLWRLFIPASGEPASEWFYFGLVIWMEVCALLSIMLFFSFAGDYFTARNAKRLYGYIAGGLSVGTLLAGLCIEPVVSVIGTANLLYFCAMLLAAGAGFSIYIYKAGNIVQEDDSTHSREEKSTPLRAVFTSPYILMFSCVVLFSLVSFVLIDFQMKIKVRDAYPASRELAAFFGNFYIYIGLAEVIIQFFVVRIILEKVGIIMALMIQPIGNVILALFFYLSGFMEGLAGHVLIITVAANAFRMTLQESVDLPGREMALLPLPSRLRIKAQTVLSGILVALGQAIGGIMLALAPIMGLDINIYSLVVIVAGIAWITILFFLKPQYQEVLATSLKNNQLDASELSNIIDGTGADLVLDQLLRSKDEVVVRFTLDLLMERKLRGLKGVVRELVRHLDSGIASSAIAALGADGEVSHLDAVKSLLDSKSEVIRKASILTFCRILKEVAFDRIQYWIVSDDQVSKFAAIIGCGRYCGDAGVKLASRVLENMMKSGNVEDRCIVGELVREIKNRENMPLLNDLLEDTELSVCIAATEACGELQLTDSVPRLLGLYEIPEMRSNVIKALERMPEESIPLIAKAARDAKKEQEPRSMLIQVIGSIGGKGAQNVLWDSFSIDNPLMIRLASGSALRQMKYNNAMPLNEAEFEELQGQLCNRIGLLNKAGEEIGGSDLIIKKLFLENARLEIECLLHLLSLKYNVRQIERVEYNIFSASAVLRGNAIELLDEILPLRTASYVVRLLEPFVEQKTTVGKGLTDRTIKKLQSADSWSRVVLAIYLSKEKSVSLLKIEVDLLDQERKLYDVIETILFLKNVPLFKDVPGNYLYLLARAAREICLKQGEVLFREGERGDTLAVIISGSIGIEIKGREGFCMEAGDCVGEMAIIDGEPRSATCAAKIETKLWEITKRDFDVLVKNQPTASLVILQTLISRLREKSNK